MAKIVEWLIDNGPEHVPTVITFLVAFRQFCEPRELFKLIVDKYLRHHYSAGFYLKLLEFFYFFLWPFRFALDSTLIWHRKRGHYRRQGLHD
jgi:hypothetical protein